MSAPRTITGKLFRRRGLAFDLPIECILRVPFLDQDIETFADFGRQVLAVAEALNLHQRRWTHLLEFLRGRVAVGEALRVELLHEFEDALGEVGFEMTMEYQADADGFIRLNALRLKLRRLKQNKKR